MLKNGYQSANTSPAIISFSIGLSHEAKGSDWSVLYAALIACPFTVMVVVVGLFKWSSRSASNLAPPFRKGRA